MPLPVRSVARASRALAQLIVVAIVSLAPAYAATAQGAESDRIAKIGGAYMRFVAKRPALARLMFGPQLPNREQFTQLGEAADSIGAEIGATPAQTALAWILTRGDDVACDGLGARRARSCRTRAPSADTGRRLARSFSGAR